jgi:hypothetical protein
MKQLHPSFGPVPPAEFKRAMNAPALVAADIIRKYDPSFGKTDNASEPKKFRVRVRREVSNYERATVEVEAASKEDAETLVEAMPPSGFDWSYSESGDADTFYVENTEEVER